MSAPTPRSAQMDKVSSVGAAGEYLRVCFGNLGVSGWHATVLDDAKAKRT